VALDWLSRDEFLSDYWDYSPGQHVSIIQPTGGGKTVLINQLLRETMRQYGGDLPARVTIPKRKDPGQAAWNAALGLREVPTWPPPFYKKNRSYALWPRHIIGQPGEDPDEVLARDRAHVERQIRACAMDSFQTGNCLYIADDIHHQAVTLGMNNWFTEILTMGRSQGCGLWGGNQKPSGTREGSVTSFFYDQPTHLFLGYDGDDRNRRRFGEIGGIDPRFVSETVLHLPVHQIGKNNISDLLYISKAGSDNRGGPAMCIVGP